MRFSNSESIVKTLFCSLLLLSLAACGDPEGRVKPGTIHNSTTDNTVDPTPEGMMDNGIFVDRPKLYDNHQLELMLQDASRRLQALNLIDQASIAKQIGTIQGSNTEQRDFAFQITGLPTAGVTTKGTTSNSTGKTITTDSTGTSTSNQTSRGTGSETDITKPSVSPAVPGLNAATAPAAPALNLSASTILAEQMQLTYEIANLRLMLAGALTDQFIDSAGNRMTRVTVGFPVKIAVPEGSKYENSVAEVEVTVQQNQTGATCDAAPGLVSILPREKTYNTAEIRKSSESFAGAAVVQVVSFGASFLHARQTYYLLQDQDTLALIRRSTDNCSVTFGWQFRPVLGRKTVQAGLRQVFAQLAFNKINVAANGATADLGKVFVRTRWLKYNRKTGAVGDKGKDQQGPFANKLPDFRLESNIDLVNWQDVGSGQVAVSIYGSYLSGTRARIGSTVLSEESTGFSLDTTGIHFTIAATQIFPLKDIFIITPDGSEKRIVQSSIAGLAKDGTTIVPAMCPTGANSLQLGVITASPHSSTDMTISVPIGRDPLNSETMPPIVLVGSAVFGLGDAPLTKTLSGTTLQNIAFNVPTASIRAAREITVLHPFCGAHARATASVSLDADFVATKAVKIRTAADGKTQFAVIGTNLRNNAGQMVAFRLGDEAITPAALSDDVLLIELTKVQQNGAKALVLSRNNAEPAILSLDAPPPKLEFEDVDPVPQGFKGAIKVKGKNLNLLSQILDGTRALPVNFPDTTFSTLSVSIDEQVTQQVGFRVWTAVGKDESRVPIVLEIQAPKKK
jgi:hypothetical protein